jgi:2-keto-4-pentenoate hydratase/2-oxohepta-3-ene-1,7-dioic acid hydratase in catechol pathway
MRIARLRQGERHVYARLEGGQAHVLDRAPWEGDARVLEVVSWSDVDLASPIAPSKIVCVGRNYVAHARELGHDVPAEPLLFLKPPSALVGPAGVVALPPESARVEHEAELGVVIGARARHVARERALAHVYGYTCVCDVTARDLQKKDGQWTRAKGFDTFCPAGPWIETELDPKSLRIVCRVNGQVRQDGPTSLMVFDVPTLVAYASRVMTLEPGDLIVTGTPEGTGPLVTGDSLEIEITGIGTLAVKCAPARVE